MTKRNDFITRPATLDRLEIRVDVAQTPDGPFYTVWAEGRCTRRRRPLWTFDETVPAGAGIYDMPALVHHLALVCDQDAPSRVTDLERALMGNLHPQQTLWPEF